MASEKTTLIIDTFAGLCNQMMDIKTSVDFAVKYNYKFCFRNCSLRNSDLLTWYKAPFNTLFDEENFNEIDGYISYRSIDFKNKSIWNEKGESLITSSEEIHFHAQHYNFLVLNQTWKIFGFEWVNLMDIPEIKPSSKIYNEFVKVLENLPKKFNFIHYRYEHDFVNHFIKKGGVRFPQLNSIINTNLFKDSILPIYLATSSAAEIYKSLLTKKTIFFTDETKLPSFNFEEAAFVDFMVGKMGNEVCGHSRSAFSCLLNQYKNTKNFYDKK